MKFSLGWLKEHLDTAASAAEISARLNAIGLEVEGLENPADRLAGFTVARVISAERHPNADKLQVLSVDAGDGKPLQVVCGAPNARAGMIGVLGTPGAIVPGGGFELKVSAIRGVESNGMMCSVRELELGDEHDGILELPADAPVGMAFADYQGSDPVFDISITPNRQDCMGVRGIARDLAAAGLGTLRPLAEVYRMTALEPASGTGPAPDVATLDPHGCPAFYAQAISGVTNGTAPEWMRSKLASIGQKPISMLVDITNFISVDLGRPLHVYDRAKLAGPLVARRAKDGEQVETLNGKTYTLDATMTVIADDAMVHDIGGIMGGAHSGVSPETTEVLIECAYFDPEHIARTGQKLALTSDARQRFERGVDPAFLDDGLAIATWLVLEHCGGTASAITRAGRPPLEPRVVSYDTGLCERLGGITVAADEQRAILERLGFSVGADWSVTVPTWRRDIDGPPDLVEEVVRIHGLGNVASVALPRADGVARPTATPAQKLERKLRRAAAARGLNEAVTWSFLPEADAAQFADGTLRQAQGERSGLWLLQNPISEDMKAMRPSLLPGLLSAVARNLDRGAAGLRLFELGRRYLRGDAGRSDERLTLGVVLAGENIPRGWDSGKAATFGAFDAKAEALALLAEAGVPTGSLQVAGEAGDQFHPGQSATLRLGPKTVLARFGMLHPAVLKHFDIAVPVAAVELFLDAIPARKAASFARVPYAPPALQAVTRDFAFLVDASLPAGDLVRAVRFADKANIVGARLFDDFRGAGVPEGQKSLAIEVTLQPGDKSFNEAELKAIAERVTAAAAKLGAVLRG